MCPPLIAQCAQEVKSPDPGWEMVHTLQTFKPLLETGFVAGLIILVVVITIAVALVVWD